MVTKVFDAKDIVEKGVTNPKAAFPEIRKLAESDDWKMREVAATVLVEISRKKPDEVIPEMTSWADDSDLNVRRAASEGLRLVARKNPQKTLLRTLTNSCIRLKYRSSSLSDRWGVQFRECKCC